MTTILLSKKIQHIFGVIIFFVIFFTQHCNAQEKTFSEGYKDAKWGMTKEQVKANFPDIKFKNEGENMTLFSKIASENVIISFYFTNKKLFHVITYFDIKTLNYDRYISKFNELEKLLIKKYGKAVKKIRLGNSDKVISGVDIAMGKDGYGESWHTSESKIQLVLMGDNFKITLAIDYLSKDLKNEVAENKENKILNNL